MKDIRFFLIDIQNAIGSIESFVDGMDFDEFEADDKSASAVLRKLEIIGEAVKKIPVEIRHDHANVPWKQMAGLRDILIHQYFEVDTILIWETITDRLPIVKIEIAKMLKEISL